jgi:hypothetical protein
MAAIKQRMIVRRGHPLDHSREMTIIVDLFDNSRIVDNLKAPYFSVR